MKLDTNLLMSEKSLHRKNPEFFITLFFVSDDGILRATQQETVQIIIKPQCLLTDWNRFA